MRQLSKTTKISNNYTRSAQCIWRVTLAAGNDVLLQSCPQYLPDWLALADSVAAAKEGVKVAGAFAVFADVEVKTMVCGGGSWYCLSCCYSPPSLQSNLRRHTRGRQWPTNLASQLGVAVLVVVHVAPLPQHVQYRQLFAGGHLRSSRRDWQLFFESA